MLARARALLSCTRDLDVLFPYFYGYMFAASGIVGSRSLPGMTARAGFGLGWNTLAGDRLPNFTPGALSPVVHRGPYSDALLWAKPYYKG